MGQLDRATIEQAIASKTDQILNDGASLSLKIRGGSALWIYKWREGAKVYRSTSLGSWHHGVGLSAARNARNKLATTRYEQRIPRRGLSIIQSAAPALEPVATVAKRMRFADVVESFISLRSSEWKVKSREPDHYRRLKTGALGKLWADEIDHRAVETELQTRWGDALANADKMRIRIMLAMSHAVAKGVRVDGPNPARKEIIGQLIQSAPKTKHRPAMKRDDVPAFVAELVADGSPAARSLAFLILTVARNGEARLADWSEIVGDAWIIPGGRDERSAKEGEEHIIPLSPAALALLGSRKASGSIFGAMHKNALLNKLHVMRPEPVNADGDPACVHGFRSTFTGWARANGYPKDLYNEAKAHVVDTESNQAYDKPERDDYLRERRPMLQSWSDFVMKLAESRRDE
jgi:integrase